MFYICTRNNTKVLAIVFPLLLIDFSVEVNIARRTRLDQLILFDFRETLFMFYFYTHDAASNMFCANF